MLRITLVAAAAASLFGSPAFAQAASTLSGFYLGLDGAALDHSGRQNVSVNDPLRSLSSQGQNADQSVLFANSVGKSGAVAAAGVHLLYQRQFGPLVAGGLIDFLAAGGSKHSTESRVLHDPTQGFPDYTGTTNGTVKTRWVSTARARLGYALDRLLPYVDGGFVAVRSNAASDLTISNTGNPPSDFFAGSRSRVTYGYAVGAGLQYVASNHVSLGADYMYYRAGSIDYRTRPDTFTVGDQPSVSQSLRYKVHGNVIRASVEYKF